MAARSDPLIDVAALAEAIATRPPVLLDVRWQLGGPPGLDAYTAGHLPGAVFVDLERELSGPPGPRGRHPLPDATRFAATMRAKGVSRARRVVVYDAGGALAAARAWWLLRYFGHPDVAVLDGGVTAWQAAGHALTTEVPTPQPGDFEAAPGGMPALDADDAGRVAASGVLLDARAGERFRGEQEPIDPVAGHIPGARSRPATENLAPDGRFFPAERLGAAFAALGAVPGVEVGAYCGSGVTAAQLVLALEIGGVPAALYPGSWSEWVADPDRPVAVGA